jgi:hypothetical protein
MSSYIHGVHDTLTQLLQIKSTGPSWASGFALGAGVGLFAGALAALLTTPASGPELRGQLGSRAKQLAARTQYALSDASDKLRRKPIDEYDVSDDVVLGT